jgi:hypothetical protein
MASTKVWSLFFLLLYLAQVSPHHYYDDQDRLVTDRKVAFDVTESDMSSVSNGLDGPGERDRHTGVFIAGLYSSAKLLSYSLSLFIIPPFPPPFHPLLPLFHSSSLVLHVF